MIVIRKNVGSAVVEACVTIPLFLFFMLYIIYVYRMIYVDAHIHQCLCEASIYYAEKCYAEEKMISSVSDEENSNGSGILAGAAVINTCLRKYLGDDPLIEQVVVGGKNGIVVTVMPDADNKKIFVSKAHYFNRINIPLLADFTVKRELLVKQKAFLGYDKSEGLGEDDIYVYVTPNESVYHLSRDCTHLKRTIHEINGHSGYDACSFCVKDESDAKVYVTDNGRVYHNNIKCLGLKRTVTKVKKSSVSGLLVCTRCGK